MNPAVPNTLQLRDIHLPPPVDLWPPAPGWWLLAAALLALLGWGILIAWRQLKLHRQRRHILSLLEQLEHSSQDRPAAEFLAQLSALLKRIALSRYPRHSIAALSGRDWLRFLDESGGNGRFCDGPGAVLADGPYLRDADAPVDTRALTQLVRDWVRKNTSAEMSRRVPATSPGALPHAAHRRGLP